MNRAVIRMTCVFARELNKAPFMTAHRFLSLLAAVTFFVSLFDPVRADDPPPPATEAVMVSGSADARLVEAVESARRRGARTRGWIVGEADVDLDAAIERVGIGWPL